MRADSSRSNRLVGLVAVLCILGVLGIGIWRSATAAASSRETVVALAAAGTSRLYIATKYARDAGGRVYLCEADGVGSDGEPRPTEATEWVCTPIRFY